MTEENAEMLDSERTYAVVEDTMAKLVDAADVGKVYGRPVKQGDVAVITASENLTFMGFGIGGGSGGDTRDGSNQNRDGSDHRSWLHVRYDAAHGATTIGVFLESAPTPRNARRRYLTTYGGERG